MLNENFIGYIAIQSTNKLAREYYMLHREYKDYITPVNRKGYIKKLEDIPEVYYGKKVKIKHTVIILNDYIK